MSGGHGAGQAVGQQPNGTIGALATTESAPGGSATVMPNGIHDGETTAPPQQMNGVQGGGRGGGDRGCAGLSHKQS